MKKLTSVIKNYPLSVACFCLIVYLSFFFTPPKSPLNDVDFIDKWTHLVMYGGWTIVMFFEISRLKNKKGLIVPTDERSGQTEKPYRLLLSAWLLPVVVGGVIEICQENLTSNRSGEWLDFAADALGATLGNVLGWLYVKPWKAA